MLKKKKILCASSLFFFLLFSLLPIERERDRQRGKCRAGLEVNNFGISRTCTERERESETSGDFHRQIGRERGRSLGNTRLKSRKSRPTNPQAKQSTRRYLYGHAAPTTHRVRQRETEEDRSTEREIHLYMFSREATF